MADGSVGGFTQDKYAAVREVFEGNLASGADLGASFCATVEGEMVVDLWGGFADPARTRPWARDTLVNVYSTTKTMTALCALIVADRGELDFDAPVARYWPEFGQAGKEDVTVRCVLSHRAGLPALDRDLGLDDALGWKPVIRAIEEQRPLWVPDSAHLYHALTYGWLIGEVIRRITGLMPGAWFRTVIGDPLDLHAWIGIPESARERVAWMEPPLPDEDSEHARRAARIAADNRMVERSLTMGGAFAFPSRHGFVTFNDPAIQRAEIPAANGIGSARSLAELYSRCVSDETGRRLLSTASIEDATLPRSWGTQLSGMPDDGARWGTGFQLASPPSQPMLGPRSFGHAGAGGQLAFGDDERGVGFAYLGNQMGGYGDARARELTLAVRASLGA